MVDRLFEWLNQNAGAAQFGVLVVTIVIGGLAFWIGYTQNKINRSIEKLQDSVEIFAYPAFSADSLFLRLTNVGTIQVYLTGYQVNDNATSSLDYVLLPVAQQQTAWFDVKIAPLIDQSNKEVLISLEDQLHRQWESRVTMVYQNGAWVTSVHRITAVNDTK